MPVDESKSGALRFWKGLSKGQRLSFLLAIILALIIVPLTVWSSLHEVRTRSDAARSPGTPTYNGMTDPITGDMYDITFRSLVRFEYNTGPGESYLANTRIQLGGTYLGLLDSLYAYAQSPLPVSGVDTVEVLPVLDSPWMHFQANASLGANACIDFYTAASRVRDSYIMTLCLKNTFVNPGDTSKLAYSPAANPFVRFNYGGNESSVIQWVSNPFDKYLHTPPGLEDGPKRTRVNWLTLDSSRSSLADFTSVIYTIQGIGDGLSEGQYNELCTNPISPQKYIKFMVSATNTYPQGGNNEPVSRAIGACGYELDMNHLTEAKISLDMHGGVPYPNDPTPTAPPTNSIPTSNLDFDGDRDIDFADYVGWIQQSLPENEFLNYFSSIIANVGLYY